MTGRYRRVWVVFRKELLDTLRDRRTLLAMVVVPVVLYPVLMLVLVQALRSEKGRREAQQYQVCVPDAAHKSWLRGVLQRTDRRSTPTSGPTDGAEDDAANDLRANVAAEKISITVLKPGESPWDAVASRRYHLGVVVDPPPRRIAAAIGAAAADPPNRRVQLIYCDIEPMSEFAFHHMARVFDAESERIVQLRLASVDRGSALLTPITATGLSTAGPDQQYAKILAAIVPFLLVIMTVTGAMYPAIDLTAGERERGTLETLAVSPVPTGQIVAGKFCVVFFIAMLSTALNLGSMTAMVHYTRLDQLVAAAGGRGGATASVPAEDATADPSPTARLQRDLAARHESLQSAAQGKVGLFKKAAPIVLLCMIPFAVLFSAVMLATCSFARTFKEAQNYMMPVMMCAVIPAMVVSYMPSIKLQGLLAVAPVANVVLLIRELFLGNWQAGTMTVAVLSNCLYAAAAVSVAAKLYGTEAVLFSDVGSYRTLLLRKFLRPRARPSASLALLVTALLFPVYFYAQQAITPDADPARVRMILMAAQVLFIAAPAVFIAWYTKCDLVETFSLRGPSPAHALAAGMLAVSAWPISSLILELQSRLFGGFTDTASLAEMEKLLTTGPLVMIVLALAVAPAVCEELLFRGLLTAGLRGGLGLGRTVLAVGVLFGLFHVMIEKLAITTLMGMVLTFVCLRSGSILAAILVHVCNNGMALLATRVDWVARLYGVAEQTGDSGGIQFGWRTAVFLGLFLIGLALLARGGRPARSYP